MKILQTHFSVDGNTASCGSTTNTSVFTAVPDNVTCKRCQKSYVYMETVDAMTAPEGYPVGSPQYIKRTKEQIERNHQSALQNAQRQVSEEVSETEPVYELSYVVTSHRVKQSQLMDFMQALIAAKASNLKVVQIRG